MSTRPDSIELEAAHADESVPPAVAPPVAAAEDTPRTEPQPGAPAEVKAPTREEAVSARDAPEVVVPVDAAHAPDPSGKVEPLFESVPAGGTSPPVAPPPESQVRARKESRAAALAASAAALTPPRRRSWFTVRRVIGYGIAAVVIGWLAGLASASSFFGPPAEPTAATGDHAAMARPVDKSGTTNDAMSPRQFTALQNELHGLRQQVKDLRGEIASTRHDVTAKLAALTAAAPAPAKVAAAPSAGSEAAPDVTDAVPPAVGAAAATGDGAAAAPAAHAPSAAANAAGIAVGQPRITASIPAPAAPPALPQPAPAGLKQHAAAAQRARAPQSGAVALRGSGNDRSAGGTPGRVLDRFSLRDVARGRALVETRDGNLQEVGVGDFLPGAGRIDAIVRRGGAWVVVAERGLIVSGLD